MSIGLLMGCMGSSSAPDPADFVLLGGRVVTMDAAESVAEALAAREGRITYIGSVANAREEIGPETEVIELNGELVIPGFIEGHGHFYNLGLKQLQLDLTETESWAEVIALVDQSGAETEPGAWILGRGWHQSKWFESPPGAVEGLPRHDALSSVSPDHPVALTHASGHASLVNALAMQWAGIDRETPDPEGGQIVRDPSGQAIGMLRENAQQLVDAVQDSSWNEGRARQIVELAAAESLAKGITSFQDAGSSFRQIDLYRRMAEAGELPLRLWVMARASNHELRRRLASVRVVAAGNGFLTVRSIKKAIDGALGSHGAWLLEPYQDLASSAGLNTTPLIEIEEAAQLALEHDFQLCVHAIGDRGNRETLDLYDRVFRTAGADGRQLRWRIEHAQHLAAEDIPRFAEGGIIASMQGVHATSDGPWVRSRIGEARAREGAYVWRKLIDSGAVVTNGTDTPVEDGSPINSYYASVTRRLRNGDEFFPEQKMSRMEALRTYTSNAAYAAFEEADKGSLEVGKLADLVVLSQDLLTIPDPEISRTEVVFTVVGGKLRYQREEVAR